MKQPLFLIGNYVYTLSPGLKEDMTPWHHNTFCGHNISPGIFSFTTCACVLSSPRYIHAHWCTVMSFISDGILYIKSRDVDASLQALINAHLSCTVERKSKCLLYTGAHPFVIPASNNAVGLWLTSFFIPRCPDALLWWPSFNSFLLSESRMMTWNVSGLEGSKIHLRSFTF